jgi:hypothetical protein
MQRSKIRLLFWLLILSLSLTACGANTTGSSKIPGDTELRNETMSDTDELAYGDRLIEEYCAIDTTVCNEYGEFSVSIHIPQLRTDAEQAVKCNRQIVSIWDAYLNDDRTINESAVTGDLSVTWETCWNDSLVRLIITEKRMGEQITSVFHYDFCKGEQYSGAQLLRRLNISDEAFRTAVCRAAAREFDTIDYAKESTEARYLLRAQALASAADAVHEPNFYPHSISNLTVYVPFTIPTGAGYEEKTLHVTMPNKTTPLSAQADGITTKLDADGTLTVTFAANSRNKDYADFACGKAYPVSGCFSSYTKLFVGSMGPDYNPYLFLLTNQGAVEFVRLFGGAYFGKFVCGDPLYGLTGITDFEAAQSTVYAVGADGTKHNLSDAVNKAEQAFPQALSGIWSSTQYHGNGSAEYTLDIQPNGQMVECTFYENVPDENIHVSYTGLIGLVGIDENGLVCGYTLTGPDGNDLICAISLLPQEDTMMVQPVGGDTLLDAPDSLQFLRSVE